MVSSAFQALIDEEIGGNASSNFVTQCVHALIRILLRSATFVLANRTFNTRTRKAPSPSRFTKASLKKTTPFKGKRSCKSPSEEEDELSTSVGSSDSESDPASSDQEEDVKGGRISVA